MSQTKHRHLRVYERSRIFPQTISYYLELFKISPKDSKYIANDWGVVSYDDKGYFWWARDMDMQEKFFKTWFLGWLKDPESMNELETQFVSQLNILKKKTNDWMGQDLSLLSVEMLGNIYNEAIKTALDYIIFSEYTVDLFDDYFMTLFQEYIRRIDKDIGNDEIIILAQPAPLSAYSRYRKDLLEYFLKKKENMNRLINLVKENSWIMMSWDGNNELDMEKVNTELEVLASTEDKKVEKELNTLVNHENEIKQARESVIKKYKLPAEEINKYLGLLDKFHVLHDYRKEAQMCCNQVLVKVLKELSSRFKGLRYSDLLYYLTDEVRDLLINHKLLDVKKLKKRKQSLTLVIENGKSIEYLGKEAEEKREELILSAVRSKEVNEVKGLPASPGTYQGTAFVARDANKAIKEMVSGQVLVTSMTTIDYIPAMRKAGAVVTDDGGVTCHAAVVSREFGIPCVVGTKIATQVFKTNDKLSVDANKGLITRI